MVMDIVSHKGRHFSLFKQKGKNVISNDVITFKIHSMKVQQAMASGGVCEMFGPVQ